MGLCVMVKYTEQIATEFNFPNITVYAKYADGVLYGYEARTEKGYLMCDPTADEYRLDENGERHPFTYYFSVAGFTKNYDFSKFPYVAVPRSDYD